MRRYPRVGDAPEHVQPFFTQVALPCRPLPVSNWPIGKAEDRMRPAIALVTSAVFAVILRRNGAGGREC